MEGYSAVTPRNRHFTLKKEKKKKLFLWGVGLEPRPSKKGNYVNNNLINQPEKKIIQVACTGKWLWNSLMHIDTHSHFFCKEKTGESTNEMSRTEDC